MTTDNKKSKCLWVVPVLFTTYLLFGSFVASGNFLDLIYLLIMYGFILAARILDHNN